MQSHPPHSGITRQHTAARLWDHPFFETERLVVELRCRGLLVGIHFVFSARQHAQPLFHRDGTTREVGHLRGANDVLTCAILLHDNVVIMRAGVGAHCSQRHQECREHWRRPLGWEPIFCLPGALML